MSNGTSVVPGGILVTITKLSSKISSSSWAINPGILLSVSSTIESKVTGFSLQIVSNADGIVSMFVFKKN